MVARGQQQRQRPGADRAERQAVEQRWHAPRQRWAMAQREQRRQHQVDRWQQPAQRIGIGRLEAVEKQERDAQAEQPGCGEWVNG
jgi:hypothetical protein